MSRSEVQGHRGTALLRCDAGARHGLGHLSRCLTLAAALQRGGLRPHFILHAPPHIAERVEAHGFSVSTVAEVGEDEPAEWLSSDADFVVLDSKMVDADYVSACRLRAPVVCFDDEIARDLPCNVVVNNNVWASPDQYSTASERLALMGASFNTVAPAYFALAGRPRKGLLITLGGEDPHNHTAWLVEALASHVGDRPVHVCIGPAHPDPAAVVAACQKHLPSAKIHHAPPSLVDLASVCDLALTAGGTTCYELAAAGIAMAILAVEEHQSVLQQAMQQAGAALSLGTYATIKSKTTVEIFGELTAEPTISRLSGVAADMFPAPGADRIVTILQGMIGQDPA